MASAADSGPGTGWLILLGVGWAVYYVLHCAFWPFRACRRCGGSGKFRAPSGRAWRYCRRCGGKGAQLRTGRRIWNHLKGIHDRGKDK